MTQTVNIQFAIGGLFRCCIQSLHELYESGELQKITEARCKYCLSNMYLDGDVWGWDNRFADQGSADRPTE